MSFDTYSIARLSELDRDNLASFDCLDESEFRGSQRRTRRRLENHSLDMNYFLVNEALDEQDEGYNTTYLLKDENSNILAYISLCADAIRLNYNERNQGAIGYEMFPSLKIARLAVHKDHQKQGIGKYLIHFAISKALVMRETVGGVKFLTLDCFLHRLRFYTSDKVGFVENQIQANQGENHRPISLRLHIDEYLERLNTYEEEDINDNEEAI
ncbi:GNAT family N-acetyltransferase [Paenibacillus glycanilyticus]|uniref:GNAT family N-acetyltransferase n=1 Tax=Paenibacillus glycanilyticus TaxID=126569 RepID=UPI00203DF790|nr:GNAT family N-acetyltransferase [Paenibacillus glycanilyticus]MCM3628790.1 GNAT family N-acetyltransferase [Paenibacillus glycanilyticus]